MALGYLEIDFDSKVVPYDDEETPVKLTGKKMLPIYIPKSGAALNESLDIIKLLDPSNTLNFNQFDLNEIEAICNFLGKTVHSLAMPYWIYTPEFDANSRKYFQDKKEAKRGPFKELVKNYRTLFQEMTLKLNDLEKDIKNYYQSDEFTIADIMIASHLWGLYIVPEWQFSNKMNKYLQSIKEKCGFNYHQDFWI